jgi:hypothetical protein
MEKPTLGKNKLNVSAVGLDCMGMSFSFVVQRKDRNENKRDTRPRREVSPGK